MLFWHPFNIDIGVSTATKRPCVGPAGGDGAPLLPPQEIGFVDSQLPPWVQMYVEPPACARRCPPPGAAQVTGHTLPTGQKPLPEPQDWTAP